MENPVKMDDLYYKRCINIMYIRHISYLHITYIFSVFHMICAHDVWYIHMIYHIYTWYMIYIYVYSVLHTVWYMYIHVYPIDIQTYTLTFFIILKTQKKTTRQNCSLLIGGIVLLFYSSLVEHWPTLLENATQYATLSLCGGFLKWWYPATMGFPSKNDHFEVFWGTTI